MMPVLSVGDAHYYLAQNINRGGTFPRKFFIKQDQASTTYGPLTVDVKDGLLALEYHDNIWVPLSWLPANMLLAEVDDNA